MRPARVLLLLFVSALTATIAAGQQSLLSKATDLGPVNADSSIEITLWMKLHDQQGLDALVAAQQADKAGYLSSEQVRSRHAPSQADVARVADFLKAQGFTVSGIGQDNFFVKATATVGRVQSEFNVELHQYSLNGRTFRASTRRATLPSALLPLVSAVGGMSDLAPEPQIARRLTKQAVGSVRRQAEAEGISSHPTPLNAGSNGLFFSAQCLYPPTTVNFSDPANGITATYQGNRYGADINNGPPNLAPCGYQPSDIQTAYNLSSLYQEGLTGKGTTVAIVDAYGSTTIAYDLAAFSQFMGLPPADLTIIGTPTESVFSTDPQAGWASETTLDVEWVHAIAPGAKIVLVVTPTNSFTDLFNGIITAANVPGVVSISNSWSGFDIGIAGASEFYNAADNIFKAIGAAGESLQFSTGDFGDNAIATGGLYTTTGWPASSPFVTGIGGVSVALDSQKHIAWQTSWGTNLTEIADTAALGNPPLDVPSNEGFVFGGTGGASDTYPKPAYQRSLPGDRRLTPDISWVADPYTGVEIIFSVDAANDLAIDVIGGTSASCPMFSALWAIATQNAHRPLGQAAPRLYRLPSSAITDVVNTSSPHNVTGTVNDPFGTNPIRASELAAPLYNLPSFTSALYNSPFSTRWFVIGFGLDSTLGTGPGWDMATGLGTPNARHFVHAFSHDHD